MSVLAAEPVYELSFGNEGKHLVVLECDLELSWEAEKTSSFARNSL